MEVFSLLFNNFFLKRTTFGQSIEKSECCFHCLEVVLVQVDWDWFGHGRERGKELCERRVVVKLLRHYLYSIKFPLHPPTGVSEWQLDVSTSNVWFTGSSTVHC